MTTQGQTPRRADISSSHHICGRTLPILVLLVVVLGATLLLAACGGGGGDGGGVEEGTIGDEEGPGIPLTAYLPSTLSGLYACNSGPIIGAATIDVQESPFDPATEHLATVQLEEDTPGSWTGAVRSELPTGTPLDFRVQGFHQPGANGVLVFSRIVTRTLSASDAEHILVDAVSPPLVVLEQPPRIESITLAPETFVGRRDEVIVFEIDYNGPVNYTAEVVHGTLNDDGQTATGTRENPASFGLVLLSYDAPATLPGTPETLTVTLEDAENPGSPVTTVFPITLREPVLTEDPLPVSTFFGPTIAAVQVRRALNVLDVAVGIDSPEFVTYAWQGSGDFSQLTGDRSTISLSPFSDSSSGEVTVTVRDVRGIETSLVLRIEPGSFPYEVNISCRLSDSLAIHDDFSGGVGDASRWQSGELARAIVAGTSNEVELHAAGYGLSAEPAPTGGLAARLTPVPQAKDAAATVKVTESLRQDAHAEAGLQLAIRPVAAYGTGLTDLALFSIGVRESGGGLQTYATGVLCGDSDCSTATAFPVVTAQSTFLPGTAVPIGSTLRIRATLDDVAQVVRLEDVTHGGVLVLDVAGAYAAGLFGIATSEFLPHLAVRVANTGAFPSGGSGSIRARFDDVVLDGLPFDDFETGALLNATRWRQGEVMRRTVNEQAYFTQTAGRSAGNDLVIPAALPVVALSADMVVHDAALTASGPESRGRVRIGGHFYNDGSPGDDLGGLNGDIFAEIGMDGSEVSYAVRRCVSYDCSASESVTPGAGWVPILAAAIGTPHSVFLGWDGTIFTFQLDENPPLHFDPVAAGAPVNTTEPRLGHSRAVVGTRFDLRDGDSGTIAAQVDNVRMGLLAP